MSIFITNLNVIYGCDSPSSFNKNRTGYITYVSSSVTIGKQNEGFRFRSALKQGTYVLANLIKLILVHILRNGFNITNFACFQIYYCSDAAKSAS